MVKVIDVPDPGAPLTREMFQPLVEGMVNTGAKSGQSVDFENFIAMATELDSALDAILSRDSDQIYNGLLTVACIAAMLRRIDATGQFLSRQ